MIVPKSSGTTAFSLKNYGEIRCKLSDKGAPIFFQGSRFRIVRAVEKLFYGSRVEKQAIQANYLLSRTDLYDRGIYTKPTDPSLSSKFTVASDLKSITTYVRTHKHALSSVLKDEKLNCLRNTIKGCEKELEAINWGKEPALYNYVLEDLKGLIKEENLILEERVADLYVDSTTEAKTMREEMEAQIKANERRIEEMLFFVPL